MHEKSKAHTKIIRKEFHNDPFKLDTISPEKPETSHLGRTKIKFFDATDMIYGRVKNATNHT